MGLICERCTCKNENTSAYQSVKEGNIEENQHKNQRLIPVPKETIKETIKEIPEERIEQQTNLPSSPKKKILKKSENDNECSDNSKKIQKKKSINFEENSQKSKENSVKNAKENLKNNEKKENSNPNIKIKRREKNKLSLTVTQPKELINNPIIIEKATSDKNLNRKKFVRSSKRSLTEKHSTKLIQKMRIEEQNLPVSNEILIMSQKGKPTQRYRKGKLIGSGSSGLVYEATNLIFGNIVAMKIEKNENNDFVDNQKILNEINILKKFSHPNIVKIYEFYVSPSYYYILNEYCKYGQLLNYIKNPFSENQLAVIFYQIFSGLWHLHDNHILHRDLNLENILIFEKEKDIKTNEEYFWVKLIDFSVSKIFGKNKKERSLVGSTYYMAPEVLKHNYDEKCDVWSVGVILYIALVGKPPFEGSNNDDINKKISIGEYNKEEPNLLFHSPESQDLLSKLLEKDAKKRLTAEEAIKHPWFIKYEGRKLFSNFENSQVEHYIDNCLNYFFTSKIQSLVIAFLIHNFPDTESSKIILKLFRFLNTSGNCKLTKEEFEKGLSKFKKRKKIINIDELFSLVDDDNSGFIEFEEFLRACIDKKELLTDDYLKFAFKFLDRDGTGTINSANIMEAFLGNEDNENNKKIEKVFHETLAELDEEGNGFIDFEHFKSFMLKTMKAKNN